MSDDPKPAFVFPDPDAPRRFWWPIPVFVPADGAQEEQHFEVQFEELTLEQIEAAAELAAPRGGDDARDSARALSRRWPWSSAWSWAGAAWSTRAAHRSRSMQGTSRPCLRSPTCAAQCSMPTST